MTKIWFQIFGAIRFAMSNPTVDDSAVMNDPKAMSTTATRQLQCLSSASDATLL